MILRICFLASLIGFIFLGVKLSLNPSRDVSSIEEDTEYTPKKFKRNGKLKDVNRTPASSASSGSENRRIQPNERSISYTPAGDEASPDPVETSPGSAGAVSETLPSERAPKSRVADSGSRTKSGPSPEAKKTNPSNTMSFFGQPVSRSSSGGSTDNDGNDDDEDEIGGGSGGSNSGTTDDPVPQLVTKTPKMFWQTTELPGVHAFSSTDFGRASHWAGFINFRSTDVTASGMNMSCEDMAEGDHSAMVPLPAILMAPTDVSAVASGTDLEIELLPGDLDYGPNFVNTFLSNEVSVPFAYRCETRRMVLEDFPYFDSAPMVKAGDLTGGLTHLGFFEESSDVFRGPAGSSGETAGTQTLETGLLPVFH